MNSVTDFVLKALQITLIDLALSGDNVGVIALAIRDLPKKTANKAKLVGVSGAVILRILFATFISVLFSVSWLHIDLIGGILLLFITFSMLREGDDKKDVNPSAGFFGAVASIILADASMSLDNVLGIASIAMAENNVSAIGPYELALIIFGLALCIPVIFFGSGIVARLMGRYPIIIYICAAILVNTAFKMIFKDSFVNPYMHGAGTVIAAAFALLMLVFGVIAVFFRKKE